MIIYIVITDESCIILLSASLEHSQALTSEYSSQALSSTSLNVYF